jgi:cytochrome c oxidase assembly protein subunit 15
MSLSSPDSTLAAAPRSALPQRGLFVLCLATLFWSILVLQAGGFTTSIHAGMAFLDWPLSNGSVNPPGWLTEIDKFAEHSHRLAATVLGLCCIAIAGAHAWREPRQRVRQAAYLLLVLVVLQGGLGGLRVLLDKLNIGGTGNLKAVTFAIAHAVNAQLTIGLLALVTFMHTRSWVSASTPTSPRHRLVGKIALGLVFGVIVIGAVMRQNHFTTWVSSGKIADLFLPAGEGLGWAVNLLHRAGALLAGLAVIAFAILGARQLRRSLPLAFLLGLQITLGVISIQLPLNPHVRTVHLVVGAALFSTLCVQVALAHRPEGFLAEV